MVSQRSSPFKFRLLSVKLEKWPFLCYIWKYCFLPVVYFFSAGDPSSPPLLLLHGWGLCCDSYRELARKLSNHFFVLVPDLPGFGKTATPRRALTLDSYVRQVKSFLREQKIRRQVIVVGHSFGGRVALRLASRSPKLVSRLILTGAPGVESLVWLRTVKRVCFWIAAKLLSPFSFVPVIRRIKSQFYRTRDYGKVEGVMRETFLNIVREPLNRDAEIISCPTLLLWGMKDRLALVQDAEKMLQLIPDASLKIFTKAGHQLPFQKPDDFAREVAHFCIDAV